MVSVRSNAALTRGTQLAGAEGTCKQVTSVANGLVSQRFVYLHIMLGTYIRYNLAFILKSNMFGNTGDN
jgi:hypothetical protein